MSQYRESVQAVLALILPAAIGLVLLAEPILRTLFLYGAVTETDLSRTVPVLQIFALGLPFYSLATLTTRGFHAQRDTRTPVKVAGLSFIVNLSLSLLLMGTYGVIGLAWANLASVIIQSLVLEILWRKKLGPVDGLQWERTLPKMILSTFLMGAALWGLSFLWSGETMEGSLLLVLVGIPLGLAVYTLGLLLLRAPEVAFLVTLAHRLLPSPRLLLRWKEALVRHRLIVGLASLLVLAFIYPTPGAKGGYLFPEQTTMAGVVLIFFLQGLSMDRNQWIRGLVDWKLHLFIQAVIFIGFPLMVAAILLPTSGFLNADIRLGILYFSLLPTTIATAIVFTSKAGGSVPGALFNCLVSNFAGVFLVPTGIALIFSLEAKAFPYAATLGKLFLLVGVPILVGQLFSPFAQGIIARHRSLVRNLMEWTILFIAYCAFSESVVQRSWTGIGVLDAVVGLLTILLILIMIRVLVWKAFEYLPFTSEQRKAAFFCSTEKTIALGIPMGYSLFGDNPAIGLLLFPLILYHFTQLLLDGAIASRWNQS